MLRRSFPGSIDGFHQTAFPSVVLTRVVFHGQLAHAAFNVPIGSMGLLRAHEDGTVAMVVVGGAGAVLGEVFHLLLAATLDVARQVFVVFKHILWEAFEFYKTVL